MLSQECQNELHHHWFPHLSDAALTRLIELLEICLPLLTYGCFNRGSFHACLSTQVVWHHHRTSHLHHDAGVVWLSEVVGISPARSHVVREWDVRASREEEIYQDLLDELLAERERRENILTPAPEQWITV